MYLVMKQNAYIMNSDLDHCCGSEENRKFWSDPNSDNFVK
jgi:hypothetical protein